MVCQKLFDDEVVILVRWLAAQRLWLEDPSHCEFSVKQELAQNLLGTVQRLIPKTETILVKVAEFPKLALIHGILLSLLI